MILTNRLTLSRSFPKVGAAFVALLTILLATFSPTFAQASVETYPTEFISKNDPVVNGIVGYSNSKSPVQILEYYPEEGRVAFNTVQYNKLNNAQKKDFMAITLNQIKKSSLGVQPRNKFYNFVYNVDNQVAKAVDQLSMSASADLATASSWIRPFSGGISTVLGLIAMGIFILIGFTVLLDMAYIALPPLQALAPGDGKTGGKGSKVFSHVARQAVLEEESTGRNAVWIWMTRKFVQIILVAIVLMYFIMGQLYPTIAQFMSAFGMN